MTPITRRRWCSRGANALGGPDGRADRRFDPLAAVRTPTAGGFDLLLAGTVFQDIIFTGLPHAPQPGTEIWSEGMGSCPGGVANQAIAVS